MLTEEMRSILDDGLGGGWVMEPAAKKLLGLAGLDIPRFMVANSLEEAKDSAHLIGYPVVAKVVSRQIVHKTDVGGVEASIEDEGLLTEIYKRMSGLPGFEGLLIEERMTGLELIVGGKVDYQFGPMVMLGIGGTSVEIYQDTALRMAPVNSVDVESMLKELRARKLIEGYRGGKPLNREALKHLVLTFSSLLVEMEDLIDSADLNPVFCNEARCAVADARFILKER